MALELTQMRHVVALAEHRSFVRAAAAMRISQPALSRSIQLVERRFGSSLFVRASSGVVPTDLGRLYIERARDLLRMADELEGEAIGEAGLRTGRVDIGGGAFPSDAFLGQAVAHFVERYPRMSVQLQAGNWDDLLPRLRSRTLDFFVAEVSLLTGEPDLDVMPMPMRQALHFVARWDHPLARASDANVAADVMHYPFVTPSRIPPRVLDPLLTAHREASGRLGLSRPFPAIECNGLEPVKRIIACSDAVTATLLPCIARELDQKEFRLLGTEPWLYLHYGVVSLRGRPWTQAAEALREFVLEAETEASVLGRQLLERHRPENRGGRKQPAATKGGVRSRNKKQVSG